MRCEVLALQEVDDVILLYIWKGKKSLETKTDRPFSINSVLGRSSG